MTGPKFLSALPSTPRGWLTLAAGAGVGYLAGRRLGGGAAVGVSSAALGAIAGGYLATRIV